MCELALCRFGLSPGLADNRRATFITHFTKKGHPHSHHRPDPEPTGTTTAFHIVI
jgi:hypothetical protein